MSRWVSLFVLLVFIAVTAGVLYRVMAAFLLPLFLASVLTVIFRPLHLRIFRRWPQRPATAALLTTLLILLTVLLPLAGITTLAIREGLGAVGGDVLDRAETRIAALRERWGVELPFEDLPGGPDQATSLSAIDQRVRALPVSLPEFDDDENTNELQGDFRELRGGLEQLNLRLAQLATAAARDSDDSDDAQDPTDMKRVKWLLKYRPETFDVLSELEQTVELSLRYLTEGPQAFYVVDAADTRDAQSADSDVSSESPTAEDALAPEGDEGVSVTELRRRYRRIPASFAAVRIDLLGGPFQAWLTDVLNPTATQLDSLRSQFQRSLRNLVPSVAGQATAIVGSSLLGFVIMVVAVYYFLKDGAAMIQSLMSLSPLDDRYERELISEFESMSRAVVLATLLSAVAQAILAGIAYFGVGFESVFLLTMLTFVFAMVPFIGAAAVWVPACLWLALVDDRLWAALFLGVYCMGIVSMADNVIKPFVLHGRSNLHPLLALLSVLGGVQALGPIGILVGPMVVSFLQALLNILNSELKNLDKPAAASS